MIMDGQGRLLRKKMSDHETQESGAAIAGMSFSAPRHQGARADEAETRARGRPFRLAVAGSMERPHAAFKL